MRIAEVLLRLGSALVSWMVLYAYALWLAVMPMVGCGPDGPEMHRLLLGIAPLAAMSAFFLRSTQVLQDIHQMLRWLSVPLLLLLPFCGRSIWGILQQATVNGHAICGTAPAATWESLWAPLQVTTILFCGWMIIYSWRLLHGVSSSP